MVCGGSCSSSAATPRAVFSIIKMSVMSTRLKFYRPEKKIFATHRLMSPFNLLLLLLFEWLTGVLKNEWHEHYHCDHWVRMCLSKEVSVVCCELEWKRAMMMRMRLVMFPIAPVHAEGMDMAVGQNGTGSWVDFWVEMEMEVQFSSLTPDWLRVWVDLKEFDVWRKKCLGSSWMNEWIHKSGKGKVQFPFRS